MTRGRRHTAVAVVLAAGALLLPGCTRDWRSRPVSMWNDSRYKPLEDDDLHLDGSSSRSLVAGTVPRGRLRADDAAYTGKAGGRLATTFPWRMSKGDLQRGQERFNIYCSPCHGRMGDGTGMIVQRGFNRPPSYHIPRLLNAPVGHYFDVMSNGYGTMFSYASRVSPDDRWRIAAYIRLLQRSQLAHPEVRVRMEDRIIFMNGAGSQRADAASSAAAGPSAPGRNMVGGSGGGSLPGIGKNRASTLPTPSAQVPGANPAARE